MLVAVDSHEHFQFLMSFFSDNRDAPNRVGGRENPLLGDILSTSIGDGAGQLGKYQNRNTVCRTLVSDIYRFIFLIES